MNYQEFILEVNKHRDDKLKGQLKGLEQKYQKDYDDRYMKPFQNKEVKKAQLAPKPVHPYGGVENIMDLRTLGQRLRSIRKDVDYYNRQPKGSPLAPPGWFDD